MEKPLDILLVDNEADFLETIIFWLETKQHQVHTCNSGAEAIKFIKESPPDIVFLDINMPEMDGLETLKQIRDFNQSLPIVMVTAFPEKEKMAQAIKLGVSGFFPKTESFDELGRVIKAAIRTHKDLH